MGRARADVVRCSGWSTSGSSAGGATELDSWSSRWRSGALLGMIVLLTDNLWFAASLHAWINWLLLGAVPQLAYGPAQGRLAAGRLRQPAR